MFYFLEPLLATGSVSVRVKSEKKKKKNNVFQQKGFKKGNWYHGIKGLKGGKKTKTALSPNKKLNSLIDLLTPRAERTSRRVWSHRNLEA